jgi:spermidine synthase
LLWFFVFFLISGFCSILYEIVWLRLAMAQFGVTTALVSIVLSMFMAGLGLGSWLSGRLIRKYAGQSQVSGLRLYALTELLIGCSALLVPLELRWGRGILESAGIASSFTYYLGSGAWVALSMIPWCACMGATIPVAMYAIQQQFESEVPRSFSYLYLSNVAGAILGALLPPLLIELRGFRGTLLIAAALNCFLAIAAAALSFAQNARKAGASARSSESTPEISPATQNRWTLALLFATGLTSMGMEVVWIRQFTYFLGTMVYAFASILGIYLASTIIGSQIYRRWSRQQRQEEKLIWACLGAVALLPLFTADPRIDMATSLRLVIGIAPFSGILGFLTPMLVDRWSVGDPNRAGNAYAVNVFGCIFGPLLSGFFLLPWLSEHWVLTLLSVPWLLVGLYPQFSAESKKTDTTKPVAVLTLSAAALALVVFSRDYAVEYPRSRILRDSTATVIATGEGRDKHLLVNGVGMTGLGSATKMMAHVPLAFLDHPPQSALAICFGMGTTFRSLLSWGISTTAVELVPSVPKMFPYFHADAPQIMSSPLGHVIIDDGRRYLERTTEQYDVITIDPPPPVEAAGSSLLYTQEFYSVIRKRLRPGGILQQWLPDGDSEVRAAVTKALVDSFPHVRVFAYKTSWGYHYLASDRPIPQRTVDELVARMPEAAKKDLVEWFQPATPEQVFSVLLSLERDPVQVIAQSPRTPPMQDDRPVNEYYLLRSLERGDGVVLTARLSQP